MLKKLLVADTAAAVLAAAPTAASAVVTNPAPSPTAPRPVATSYMVKVESAVKDDWQTTVDITARVTKRAQFSPLWVGAAGQTVVLTLWARTSDGGHAVEECQGLTNAYGRISCTLSTLNTTASGTLIGWEAIAARLVDGKYAFQDLDHWDSIPVEIRCHC